MLTYTFSNREKALLLVLAVILVLVAWFVLVFQRTTEQINALEGEIATVESNATVASAQVGRMNAMQATIDKYKKAGVAAKPVPTFDNMMPLMSELNGVMSQTETYALSFDDLDTETSPDYVLRGVTIDFSCGSVTAAETVVTALAKGTFPCSIDSVAISDGSVRTQSRVSGATGNAPVSASVHVTFFEKPSAKTAR